ncbi:MAG: biotin/lipoyl-binding protein, partial [Pseudomonadales bacterium]|nr:biotin/lipoyl-binding protein [Pseudomonadales bacterium]
MTNPKLSQSPHWSRVARLRPQLREHVRTYPQEYRGERWYVLWDQSSRRHLRFSATAYAFIARLDGKISVEEAWYKCIAGLKEVALTQDEVLLILTQLFAVDVLRSDLPLEATHFFQRYQRDKNIKRRNAFMNPLAIRIPMLDPNAILNRFMPWVRPVFSKPSVFIWFLVVGLAAMMAMLKFPAIDASFNSEIFSPSNILSMIAVFIFIKTAHEFAHAFTVKMWGGDVHEMGITFLVFAPIPYVDASAAWLFQDKYKRMLVGAAGIVTELFIASLALFVWLLVEPGLVKDAAFNAMLVGSISTVVFNGNPLLRFDGYYVLQDWIEIPNLYTRSGRYYLYLIRRYLFGVVDETPPVTAEGETPWLVVYGIGAFFYRLFILTVIVMFLADEYLFIGVALASWAVAMQIIVPLARALRFMFTSPSMDEHRSRAAVVTASLLVSMSLFLVMVPISLTTRVEGVVWVSDQAQLYTGTEGFVEEVLVKSGQHVQVGTPIIRMRAPELEAEIAKLEALLRELEARGAAEYLKHKVKSKITAEEKYTVNVELVLLKGRQAALDITS